LLDTTKLLLGKTRQILFDTHLWHRLTKKQVYK
jgi:hypothetical protein